MMLEPLDIHRLAGSASRLTCVFRKSRQWVKQAERDKKPKGINCSTKLKGLREGEEKGEKQNVWVLERVFVEH